ncbi:MAG: alpha/beta fold hydrolase [Pseudonocardiaceae bacterium]
MQMHHVRRGAGKSILLVPGLGSTWQSWDPILDALASEREVIAVDLPGFGATPPLPGEVSIATLCDAVAAFIDEQGLAGIDLVGSSMGARMVLELARRGVGGTAVALAPGGFWSPGQLRVFGISIRASIKLVRALQPVLPVLTGSPVTRTLLLAQFSAHPWTLSPKLVLRELQGYAAAPSFDAALDALIDGPLQQGAPAGSTPGPVVIGWGRNDRVTLPSQAERASRLFPDAQLHWFGHCGHFPQWDAPEATIRLILDNT